jgi:hypothetical protein
MIGFLLLFTVGGRIVGPIVGEAMHMMDTILLAF